MRKTVIFLSLALAGCGGGAGQPYKLHSDFNPDQHKAYIDKGNAKIAGDFNVIRSDGAQLTCAGGEVLLMPNTSYFNELAEARRDGRMIDPESKAKFRVALEAEPAYKHIVRTSKCDAQGKFSFSKLPAARWILAVRLTIASGKTIKNGMLLKPVTTADKGTTRVDAQSEDAETR